MEQQISVYRIFIATPSDLREEREILRDIVTEINAVFARETEWRVELLGWEDTMPGGGRPQDLINVDVDKADLLIGGLWRRWGTEAGNGKTGFEEEFERALGRRTKTGEPEIWLFFKDISDEERKDPGTQLKKVLAFQTAEEEAKRLLYQRFSDPVDWRRKVRPLLNRKLLNLVTSKVSEDSQPAAKTQQPAPGPPTSTPGPQPNYSPAQGSIAALLRTTGEQLAEHSLGAFRDSPDFDNARCIRLLVFATSMYNWKIEAVELGTHECNTAFWHRRGANLLGQERLLLIKSVLLDSSLTKPGWFWTTRWHVTMTVWLPWLIRYDRDEGSRVRSLDFANEIDFSLLGRASGTAVYDALKDPKVGIRFAALRYLRRHGPMSAIRHLRGIDTAGDESIKAEVSSTIYAIRLRANPDREFRRILKDSPPLTDSLFTELRSAARLVPADTLLGYLEHTSPQLRLIAATELQRRKELPLPAALQLTSDDSRLVREKAFYSLIDHNASPSPSEIRSQLAEHPTSLFSGFGETPDSDSVVAYYFARRSQTELWDHVTLMDSDSAIAMRAIGHRFFSQNTETMRDNLAEDFERMVAAAKQRREQQSFGLTNYATLWGGDPIEAERRKVRTAALGALATRPTQSDRGLFKRFLSTELAAIDQTIACLRGLATLRFGEDIVDLKALLSNAPSPIRAAAARAYLSLSSDTPATIKELLKTPASIIVFVVVAWSILNRTGVAWEDLKPMLRSKEEDVRRLVCHYAVSTLSRRDLLTLLNEYIRGGWYYYNVVTLLDRALYAPRNIRAYLRTQEVAHFAKLSADVNRGWPGLTL